MKRLILLCCCLAAAAFRPGPGRPERDIRALADSVRATVGVAVVFDDGDTLVVNGSRPYPMLSVFKFHQALAVLDSLARGGLPLATRIPVRRSDLPAPIRGRRCAKSVPRAASSPWRNCWHTASRRATTTSVTCCSASSADRRP